MVTQRDTTTAELEETPCPLCRSTESEVRYPRFRPYRVVRCRRCRLYYLSPRLTEGAMQRFYKQADYYVGGEAGYADIDYRFQERALRATFRRLLEALQRRGMTGGDLLEVGCGYGYLVDEAAPYFRTRTATELSAEAVAIAAQRADMVYEGSVESLPADLSFDCIIATHVIEHVYEPVKFVEQLARRLKPGGAVMLAAPDMGSPLRRLMGHRWPSFKVPEHILYFDERTLARLMEQAGLMTIRRVPYPHAFPLALIAAKFALTVPSACSGVNVWVPTTTVALSAVAAAR